MGPKIIMKIIERVLEKRFGSSTNVIREIKEIKKDIKELKKDSHPRKDFICLECGCKAKKKL